MTRATMTKTLWTAALLAAGLALAQGPGPGPRRGPPPEAVQACATLQDGAACAFTLDGQHLTGTCLTRRNGAGLVCHAAGVGPRGGGACPGGACAGACADGGVCPGGCPGGCGGPHGGPGMGHGMGHGGLGGPPPEAKQACVGKVASNACSFSVPGGQPVAGTCLNRPKTGELVCHPNGVPMGITRQGPLPEALKACEGLAADAACRFTAPHGGTVAGACFSPAAGQPLACRPGAK